MAITHFGNRSFVKTGTATTTLATVDLTWNGNGISRAAHFDVRNTGTVENLLVSLDKTTFFTVKPQASYEKWGLFSEVFVKTAATSTTYEITVTPAD